MDCSTPGLPVHHQLLEFTHTHIHWVSDAIQPSHPLSSPSPPSRCQSFPASKWSCSVVSDSLRPHGGLFTIWATRERVRLQRGRCGRGGFSAWFGKILWRRKWLPAPVFLPGESHGQRNLEGYSPWRHKERDTTEGLTLYCYYTTRTELITFRNYFVFFLLPLIYKILGGKHSCVFGFFFPLLWSIFLTARKMCGT